MTKRGRIVSFGSAALLVVAGAIGAAAFSGTVGQALALALIGLGLVLATGLVFLEVGLREDKERAREAQSRKATQTESASTHGSKLQRLRPMPPMERMRGRRRRLR